MILLDTSILSVAFRHAGGHHEHPAVAELRELITAGEDLRIPGIVWQELLSGIRETRARSRLRAVLVGFSVELAVREDHEAAARIGNQCRRAGVAAATVDCLIAGQAQRRRAPLFTLDDDFSYIRDCTSLRLYGSLSTH